MLLKWYKMYKFSEVFPRPICRLFLPPLKVGVSFTTCYTHERVVWGFHFNAISKKAPFAVWNVRGNKEYIEREGKRCSITFWPLEKL